jgi:hypothetical protein
MQIEVELNGRPMSEARTALLALLKETKPPKGNRLRELHASISGVELKRSARKKKF